MIKKINKPFFWDRLLLCQKIKYYGTQLDEEYSKYVDKIEAKKIVKNKCGDLIKIAKIKKFMKNYDDLILDDIKNDCIIKTTHGCGWNILIHNNNNNNNNNNNDNDNDNLLKIIEKLKSFNKIYGIDSMEKQYSYIKPRYFIEELIKDKYLKDEVLDYMVRCINGEPISMSVQQKSISKQNSYNIKGNLILAPQLFKIPKPVKFNELLNLARLLSKGFEFVRIDFFIDINDDIYFSEFTFTPAGGNQIFPYNIEKKLGKLWV